MYLPIYRLFAVISIIVLLPKFGWVIPTTIHGLLISLSFPKHVNWDPSDDFGTITALTTVAFVLGCMFDYLSNRRIAANINSGTASPPTFPD